METFRLRDYEILPDFPHLVDIAFDDVYQPKRLYCNNASAVILGFVQIFFHGSILSLNWGLNLIPIRF